MSRKRRFTSRHGRVHSRPGESPGTLRIDPEAIPPQVRLIGFGPDAFVDRPITRPADIRSLKGKWPVTWIIVQGLGDVQVLTEIGKAFDLHGLALEDAVSQGQRPKAEPYEDHIFIVARTPSADNHAASDQVSFFLGSNYVISFQDRPGTLFDPVLSRLQSATGRLRKSGADYLLYSLLDALIDGYFPILDQIGEEMESIESEIISDPGEVSVRRLQAAKAKLREMRRIVRPLRDLLNELYRAESDFVREDTKVYLRDALDHAVQAIDFVDSLREMSTDLMSVYLTSTSNRMNEVMKALTLVTSIFIPLSFIASIYGMNFNPNTSALNMPELNWVYGYPFALVLMAVTAVALLFYFRRKRWLG